MRLVRDRRMCHVFCEYVFSMGADNARIYSPKSELIREISKIFIVRFWPTCYNHYVL